MLPLLKWFDVGNATTPPAIETDMIQKPSLPKFALCKFVVTAIGELNDEGNDYKPLKDNITRGDYLFQCVAAANLDIWREPMEATECKKN